MSVFTTISDAQLRAFLLEYDAGELVSFSGIQAGITNTNYFVDTSSGRFVLTIVEHESAEDVEWFMQLLGFLCQANIPCAEPVATKNGQYTSVIENKPATLVCCLDGADKTVVTPGDCHTLGTAMAQMHLACRNYKSRRADSRGWQWRDTTARQIQGSLDKQQRELLQRELAFQRQGVLDTLPRSVIHADLFRDNVLFTDDKISGIIDVYYACDGCMLYDIAIACNDWCRQPDGTLQTAHAQSLLTGYESIRPFHDSEKHAWSAAIRAAALRFWLSRLQDLHFPPDGMLTHTKDPTVFQAILESNQTI